jgi:hypothetical protein
MPKSKKNQMVDKLKKLRKKKKKPLQTHEFFVQPDGTTIRVPKDPHEVRET